MSYIKEMHAKSLSTNQITVSTQLQQWMIPSSAPMMRCLIEDQAIKPLDLCFNSQSDCHCFIKQLLLLALKDECAHLQPSPLAKFARELIKIKQGKIDV